MLIGYGMICTMAMMMLNILSEAQCLFPTSGSFIDHTSRFVDPALGFAIGFAEWFGALTVVAAEGAVVPVVISYWTTSVPAAAWYTIYLVIVLGQVSLEPFCKLHHHPNQICHGSMFCPTESLPNSSSSRAC
jgi:amino acid transporter